VRRLLCTLPALPLCSLLALLAAGCASTGGGFSGHGVRVVAAENFWGSLARQLGGVHASVQSIIVNPAEDPHDYEPRASDARTMATAQLAIVNGIGYDPWAPKLLSANPVDGRLTLTVGSLFGLQEGDNPHRWYDPAEVLRTADAITGDLQRLDPGHRNYFAQQLRRFQTSGLTAYHRLIEEIRRRYAGVPVGASESIFALLAPSLGLRLITPPSFMKAISEGSEVTAADVALAERQLDTRALKVWVYNSQNVTPEIQRLNGLARAHGIPVATVTDSFQQWQESQLRALRSALHRATGR
jgi:zinc/manganese transport system substrate-binding protein